MRNQISKTRGGAQVVSRDAVFTQYNTDNQAVDTMAGIRPVGGPNVDAIMSGVDYPNIQNAIDEMLSMELHRINSVYVSTENANPAGSPQTESVTFAGIITIPDILETSCVVYVYGLPFVVNKDTTADSLCNTVLAKLQDMQKRNIVFKTVQRRAGSAPILDITFIDTAPHIAHTIDSYGMTITRTITSPAVQGYGTWTYLGSENKTLTGGSVTTPFALYYFKRIA